ncbi:MAG: hypothetical protein AAF541_12175 [Pseudomonadota bacterium]
MSIQDLGSIGELVGAIAVVATLVYLAVQVRFLKSELHMATMKDQTEAFANVTNAVATSPALAAALEKAKCNDPMEGWEERMAHSFFLTWMNAFELLHNQAQARALAIPDLSINTVLSTFLRSEPWVLGYWAENKNYWPPSLQQLVDQEIERLASDIGGRTQA